MTTVCGSLASLSRKSSETESILLYTYKLETQSEKVFIHLVTAHTI